MLTTGVIIPFREHAI